MEALDGLCSHHLCVQIEGGPDHLPRLGYFPEACHICSYRCPNAIRSLKMDLRCEQGQKVPDDVTTSVFVCPSVLKHLIDFHSFQFGVRIN